jgi:hypothetical protein
MIQRPDYATKTLAPRLLGHRQRLMDPEELTLSWNKPTKTVVIASLIAVLGVPALAYAQRGGGRGRVVARPVIVAPYYSRYYDPFWGFYGWGYPGWYGPSFYNPVVDGGSSLRIQVTPRQTEVYVDGYLAGVVDDFDGISQRLRVAPGEHVIELYLDGHKTIAQSMLLAPGQSYRIRHAMEPLPAGEPAPARPAPKPGATAPTAFDAFGQPLGRGPGGLPSEARSAKEGATIAIRVQPGDAAILVDGERWQTSGGDRLEIQVTPGEHRIEVQKDGYQPFATSVRVGPGETAPVNVSLTKSGDQ